MRELINEIQNQIWVQTAPENLATPINGQRWSVIEQFFIEALGEIQKDVPTEQEFQCNTIEFCETFHKTGLTVVPCPEGIIHRVYTVQRYRDNSGWDWSRPVYYRQRRRAEIENWARTMRRRIPYDDSAIPKLPLGFERASKKTDSKHGRANSGMYAIHDHNLHIAPWIQSNEMIVVEWTGIKGTSQWRQDDLLSDEPALKKAIKLHVQFAYERDHGEMERAKLFKNDERTGYYDDALSELMLLRQEQTRVRRSVDMPQDRRSESEWHPRPKRGEPYVPDVKVMTFAHIGNSGANDPNSNSTNAAILAKSWLPASVLSTGGNISQFNSSYISYDLAIGQNWYSYIEPYIGTYGQGAETNQFFPTIDDADWGDSALAPFKQFFALPNNGRYYDVCRGHVHFFFLDSSSSEPDGNTATAQQAEWLKVKLMTSPARWKIIVLSAAPFSSDGSDATLQWPFAAWGADLVLSGGATFNYERLLIGNMPYVVNGLGGGTKESVLPSPITGSQFLYNGNYGAGRLSVSDCALYYEFVALDGSVVDSVGIIKPGCVESDSAAVQLPWQDHAFTIPTAFVGQLLTGPWSNPNGNVTPGDITKPAQYTEDQADPVQLWAWSLKNQNWFPLITA